MTVYTDSLVTPIGPLEVIANESALTAVRFVDHAQAPNPNAITILAINQLSEYFAGSRQVFDLPLHTQGTDFQHDVWRALQSIHYGTTQSYAQLASHVNRPQAVRAVGSANGRNPIGIVIPCHRVIASDGSLSGFAHGVDRKAWLLAHEAAHR